jgi:aspartate carbamoyltransferase catalytic subunit
MKNMLYQSDLISVRELSLEHIQQILDLAKYYKAHPVQNTLQGKVVANCFFESSTRTRLSFEAATFRSGGQVIGFTSDEALSVQKGETLEDTIRVIADYADAIVIRHPREGAARLAAEVSDKPVINAGDGSNQHPTQTLVDLFSMQESQQKLDGLSIALVGDLKYGRTIHSLTQACELFDVRLYLVSPESLTLPESMCDRLKKRGVRFSFHRSIEEVLPKVDILYMTRIQQERFGKAEYQLVKDAYILTPAQLKHAKPNLKILHPLPRVNEIDVSVDKLDHAYYFQQSANGVFVRQALLTLLLNNSIPKEAFS